MLQISINHYQARVYYNIYMLKSVYFRYRIIDLNEKEKDELRRTYEELLLRKLGLSIKFLRIVIHE